MRDRRRHRNRIRPVVAGAGLDVRWIVERHRRDVPGDVADVVGPAAALLFVWNRLASAQRVDLGRETRFRNFHFTLHRLGQRLIGFAPLRQSDLLDIRVHRLGDRLVHVPRPRGAENAHAHFGIGHHRGRLGHRGADVPQLLDLVVAGLAEVVPDGGVGRHDVRLVAAVGDDVMRALLQPQVLAAEVPADVHQLHGVERRPAAPRRASGVGALALEGVFH